MLTGKEKGNVLRVSMQTHIQDTSERVKWMRGKAEKRRRRII